MPHSDSATPYFRLRASGLLRSHEDDFTQGCFATGAAGVAEDLKFQQNDLCYEPEVIETPVMDVNVYFTQAPSEDALLKLQGDFPGAKWELFTEENRDWLAEWKKGFKPFLFAGDFWIVPSWCEPPSEASKDPSRLLFVEPGMAFGTGTHETTRLAATYTIETCLAHTPKSVLDVGTGTGILALVAQRLGASEVVGIDNDPEARRTARENLAANHAAIDIPETSLENIGKQFDLVIANIIDGVLSRLQHELARVVRPGGHLILSGVLVEREDTFYRDFTAATGLRLLCQTHEGEWSAAVLQKELDQKELDQ